MSLEQQIETLNANFATLIALMSSGGTPAKPASKPAKEQTQSAATPSTDAPSSSAAASAPATSSADSLKAQRDQCTASVIKICAKNKPKAIEILAKYNAKKVPEIVDGDLTKALADLNAAVTELSK